MAGNLGNVFVFVLQYLWAVIIAIGFGSYVIANKMMRTINVTVMYHRIGTSLEVYKAKEIGNRVRFTVKKSRFAPIKSEDVISVVMDAKPEIQVKGLNTYRIHHVVEGYGQTVDPRMITQIIPSTQGQSIATSMAVMGESFEQMGRSFPRKRGDVFLMFILSAMAFVVGVLLGISPLLQGAV